MVFSIVSELSRNLALSGTEKKFLYVPFPVLSCKGPLSVTTSQAPERLFFEDVCTLVNTQAFSKGSPNVPLPSKSFTWRLSFIGCKIGFWTILLLVLSPTAKGRAITSNYNQGAINDIPTPTCLLPWVPCHVGWNEESPLLFIGDAMSVCRPCGL